MMLIELHKGTMMIGDVLEEMRRWNAALFEHVFRADGQESHRPVVRIPVQASLFAAAIGESVVQGEKARTEFIRLFHQSRLPYGQFRALFNSYWVGLAWNREHESPPFFAQLVFTLIAASSDEDTSAEGNFRNRIAILRGEAPEEGVRYPIDFRGLPRLWFTLQEWLDESVRSGGPYRPLTLPDPGRRDTRIGYSKCLAFPTHKDYTYLTAVLSDEHLSAESPVALVLSCVSRSRSRFSRGFQKEFDDFFRSASSRDPALSSHPFWAAVCNITWEHERRATGTIRQVRYQLELLLTDPRHPDISLLTDCATSPASSFVLQWSCLPPSYDPYLHAAMAHKSDAADGSELLCLLESATFVASIPRLRSSYLTKCATEGLLCFAEDDAGRLVSCESLPQEGRVCLIARYRLLEALSEFARVFFGQSPVFNRIGESSWGLLMPTQVSAFSLWLRHEDFPLDGCSCFDWRLLSPSIKFRNNIRVGKGHLFRGGHVPGVVLNESDTILCRTGETEADRFDLFAVPCSPEHGEREFRFPPSEVQKLRLPCELELQAWSQSRLLAHRSVYAVRTAQGWTYRKPGRARDWLHETNDGHLTGLEGEGLILQHPNLSSPDTTPPTNNRASDALAIIENSCCSKSEHIRVLQVIDIERPWSDLIEVMAAQSANKQGLDVSELLDFVKECLGITNSMLQWDIIRALEENCFIERLTLRRWNGVRFFAQAPTIVNVLGQEELRIVGIMPELLRMELCKHCSGLGLRPEFAVLENGFGVSSMRIRSAASQHIEALNEGLSLPVVEVGDIVTHSSLLARHILATSRTPSMHVSDDTTSYLWNWNTGRFDAGLFESDLEKGQVWRMSRNDRPDEYSVVLDNTSSRWTTWSGNWALLVGAAVSNHTPPFCLAEGTVTRNLPGGVYLPLALARTNSLLGQGPSGPIMSAGMKPVYVYPFGSNSLANQICSGFLKAQNRDHPIGKRRIERWRSGRLLRSPGGKPIVAGTSRR